MTKAIEEIAHLANAVCDQRLNDAGWTLTERCLMRAPIFSLALNTVGYQTMPAIGQSFYDPTADGLSLVGYADMQFCVTYPHVWVRDRSSPGCGGYDNSLTVDAPVLGIPVIQHTEDNSVLEELYIPKLGAPAFKVACGMQMSTNRLLADALGVDVGQVEETGDRLATHILKDGDLSQTAYVLAGLFGGPSVLEAAMFAGRRSDGVADEVVRAAREAGWPESSCWHLPKAIRRVAKDGGAILKHRVEPTTDPQKIAQAANKFMNRIAAEVAA